MIKTGRVFKENLKAFFNDYTIIANEVGTRSGKTLSILQLICEIMLLSDNPLVISCV